MVGKPNNKVQARVKIIFIFTSPKRDIENYLGTFNYSLGRRTFSKYNKDRLSDGEIKHCPIGWTYLPTFGIKILN